MSLCARASEALVLTSTDNSGRINCPCGNAEELLASRKRKSSAVKFMSLSMVTGNRGGAHHRFPSCADEVDTDAVRTKVSIGRAGHCIVHHVIPRTECTQSCTPSCTMGGSDRQHSTADARPIAVSRNGDSAAARTASEARCISACTVNDGSLSNKPGFWAGCSCILYRLIARSPYHVSQRMDSNYSGDRAKNSYCAIA